MKTAVLFLVFNRPDTTVRVFETIRQACPPRLYLAADGPRKNRTDENEKCEETRSIIKQVDWNCEVKTLFRNENLGCGKAVSEAITWFFDQEEEGIILEDDVLPHPDFFPYCEELLEKYRNDYRIQLITGRNAFFSPIITSESYYFSGLFHIWGWATWKRVWVDYKFDLSFFPIDEFYSKASYYGFKPNIIRYWERIFELMKCHSIDTWDYQLLFSQWYHQRYSIIPMSNLTQNIGFGEGATHTFIGDEKNERHEASSIMPLIHPLSVTLNTELDIKLASEANWYMSYCKLMILKIKNVLKPVCVFFFQKRYKQDNRHI